MALKRIHSIKGKNAVVTGADGGIGFEFCRELGRLGCNVIGVSNRGAQLREAMQRIKEEFGVKTTAIEADLAHEGAAESLMQALHQMRQEPDILINNAGIFSFRPVTELSQRQLDIYVDLHVRSVMELSRLAAISMKERGEGMILNMSSMSCWTPMPGIALYSATKAFIRAYSRALHYELRDDNVSVTVACPGGIATDLFGLPANLKKLAVAIGAIALPDRFVHKAIGKMMKRRAQYVNGLINRLAIFFVGITPRSVRMLIKHLMLDRGIRVN